MYYTDEQGAPRTPQARLVYPESDENARFGGEGDGVHRIGEYPWREGRWYRMLLQRGASDVRTTLVDQRVCDRASGEWTRLCCYDTGIEGAALVAPSFFFLENYDASACGEPACSGGYAYGAQGNRFLVITSGVGGDWYGDGRGQAGDGARWSSAVCQ